MVGNVDNSDHQLGVVPTHDSSWKPDPDAAKPRVACVVLPPQPTLTPAQLEKQARFDEYHAKGVDSPELERAMLAEAATLRAKAATLRAEAAASRNGPRPPATLAPGRAHHGARTPRGRRSVRRGMALARDDPEPEPPRLTAARRRQLKQLVDLARRAQIARLEAWRTCACCRREQEPEEFSRGAKYCRSCERDRVRAYRRRLREPRAQLDKGQWRTAVREGAAA